ncbi:hypothetical protein QOZ80_2AG0148890 [Eleusine coracana subsp. coracana]|nr:hypothetical protein QOZ80_2AG0148890 [Eleusine coracana subsp. coracana]
MVEAAATTAAEGLMHRRIEFHAATKPNAPPPMAGGFPMERFFSDAGKHMAAARTEGESRRFEKGESSGSGFDPELSAARIYLRRIGAGLYNPGYTCYLNSVLQCLTYTEPFVAYLQTGNHKSLCQTAGFCALCALQSHVRSALQSTGKILAPLQFIKNLRSISRSFRQHRQEDAHELMVSLLESMHKCCLPSGVPSESPRAYKKSLVHRIFGGRLRSQVKCARCLHCSNKFDPFLDLSLEIGNATTLVKALHNFTKEELLDGGEKHYNCQHCKQKVVAKKRFTIDKAPSVLTIHLKRFSPFNPLRKIDKKVDFQTALNLKPFVSDSEVMDLKYNLYSVLVHTGGYTQFGHYYCFVRTSSGIWHNLDDTQVCQVREGDVLRQKAYMLFYVRDSATSPIVHKYNSAASLSSNKKMIPEKIVCMDGTIRNGLVKSAMKVSSFASEDAKMQKQNQTSNICNTSQIQFSNAHNKTEVADASTSQDNVPASVKKSPFEDKCSNTHNKTEVIDASTSQNNVPALVLETHLRDLCFDALDKTEVIDASVQKAPITNLNSAATVFIPKQIDSESQREMMPSGQHDICILCAASSDQKACKESLQKLQLKSDGSPTDLGKDVADATHPICNGADGLLGANDQATEPQPDPFCKPIPDNDTEPIVQIIPTEDTVVSNQSVSTSTSGNVTKETERIKQHDELAIVKELSVNGIDDKQNEVGQTFVPDKEVQERQPLMKELSVMDIDHVVDAEQTSVQNHSLDSGQVCNKKQNLGDSTSSVGLTIDNQDSKDASLSSAELARSDRSSVANPDSGKCATRNEKGSSHFDLLTRGLRQITVSRWDDNDMPDTTETELQRSSSASIGYVLDEWDEEYDRGRRKKVKRPIKDFGGPNPFQETANIRSWQGMGLKAEQARRGNQPLRK